MDNTTGLIINLMNLTYFQNIQILYRIKLYFNNLKFRIVKNFFK